MRAGERVVHVSAGFVREGKGVMDDLAGEHLRWGRWSDHAGGRVFDRGVSTNRDCLYDPRGRDYFRVPEAAVCGQTDACPDLEQPWEGVFISRAGGFDKISDISARNCGFVVS